MFEDEEQDQKMLTPRENSCEYHPSSTNCNFVADGTRFADSLSISLGLYVSSILLAARRVRKDIREAYQRAQEAAEDNGTGTSVA